MVPLDTDAPIACDLHIGPIYKMVYCCNDADLMQEWLFCQTWIAASTLKPVVG
jgi:hypothetical protein